MPRFQSKLPALALGAMIATMLWATPVAQAQTPAKVPTLGDKLQPYIKCINRLSERAHSSNQRYLSWVKGAGPTGKERIIYGLYTIYDTQDCRDGTEKAAKMEPANADLEKAGADYAAAVGVLEPLLKEADDYYSQSNYKDDKMAKGKAMHPKLIAAWAAFDKADAGLRSVVQRLNDQLQLDQLAALEKQEGRKSRFLVLNLMVQAKALQRLESDPAKMDLPKVTAALETYETSVKELETYSAANPNDKTGTFFIGAAKDYLTSAKGLMRRVRDKVRYSQGDLMMMQGGGGWMVEGSPPRLLRDYNQLIDRFNSSSRI